MQRCVVCIEDEPEIIELLNLIVQKAGYEFVSARGGVQGIEVVEQLKPDLVLLDLMMPDVDGWEVYDHLKAHPATQHIPIIVVTARAQHDPRVISMRVNQADYLVTKPFAPAQLMATIDRVLAT